jgi:GNAT superfamily N-acetyltransferase
LNPELSNELLIRPVAKDDYERWLPLWDSYNAFYGRSGATALPRGITQVTWTRFFDDGEAVHALVAETHGQLVGLAHYLFHRSTIHLEAVCYLQDLFTSENARGKGIGRALITEVYEQAERAGSGRVYWQTHESNIVAQRLYDKVAQKNGFIVYHQRLRRG